MTLLWSGLVLVYLVDFLLAHRIIEVQQGFFQLKMNCSICTELTVETCHGLFHVTQVGLISVDQLDAMDVKLIAYRTGLDEDKIQTISYHHKQTLLTNYEWLKKRCCNPSKNHKKANQRRFETSFIGDGRQSKG